MLDLETISVAYGPTAVVRDLSLHLNRGEIGCLLGASGCGKTTTLRAIAGFEPLQSGVLRLDGETVASARSMLAPEARQIGVVFQDYALFPHLNVAENIAFGLQKHSRNERRTRVQEMLDLVGLEAAAPRFPHELSGGQQQRVALARALAPRPRLMLMDEPFSNLDVTLRERLATEVRHILKRAGATAILVTHDQREAFAMADKVGVMTGGRLCQWDTPYALYHQPADVYVAEFVGEGVLLPATLQTNTLLHSELGMLEPLPTPSANALAPSSVGASTARESHTHLALIRPEALLIDKDGPISAQILTRAFRGAEYLYTLQLSSGAHVLAHAASYLPFDEGQEVGLRLRKTQVSAFPV